MRWGIATLVINEMEWLPYLYEQHKNFPGLIKWVFVESADVEYAKANPDLVTSTGLSVDGTSTFLQELEGKDKRVQYVPYGFSEHTDKAQGKCPARNVYLEILDHYDIDYLLLLDGDEFWTYDNQRKAEPYVLAHPDKTAFTIPHREIWYPPYYRDQGCNLFDYEVVGGFWAIVINRLWKYSKGMRYKLNHNTPEDIHGRSMKDKMLVHTDYRERHPESIIPEFIHMGFAAKSEIRCAKNKYYEDRGEKTDPHRAHYTVSRGMWKDWTPGIRLLERAVVKKYTGSIPEVFLSGI